jgi:hypothetical protein
MFWSALAQPPVDTSAVAKEAFIIDKIFIIIHLPKVVQKEVSYGLPICSYGFERGHK